MRKSATLDRVVSGTMKLVAVLIGELYSTVKIIILVSLDTIPKYYVRSSLVIR